jgi:hypothetical protein
MLRRESPDAAKILPACGLYGWKTWLVGGIICVLSLRPLRWQLHVDVIPATDPERITFVPLPKEPRKLVLPRHPRVLQYELETNGASRSISDSSLPKEFHRAGKSYEMAHSSDEDDDEESARVCQLMHEWQTRIYPSCNNVHEVNMRPETGSVVFINCEKRYALFDCLAVL